MNKHLNWLLVLALLFQPAVLLAEEAKKDAKTPAPAATSLEVADTEEVGDEWTDDEAWTDEDLQDEDLGDLDLGDEEFTDEEALEEIAPAAPAAEKKK